jgi:hypothetical protein
LGQSQTCIDHRADSLSHLVWVTIANHLFTILPGSLMLAPIDLR